jgi:hypothetical protein
MTKLNRLAVVAVSLGALAACDADTLVSVAETADSLESAQTDFCTFRAEADACRQAFDACVAVEGADLEACRTALHDCLPPPPERPEGMCRGGGDGGVRPPPPDGGVPPPGGLPPPGGRPGPGGGGHHRPGPIPVHPEPAAIQACRDALEACLAATPGDVTCQETERQCVRDAFRAAFDAACADVDALCASLPADAPADACARVTARCTEGIDGRAGADGGVCVAPPVVP